MCLFHLHNVISLLTNHSHKCLSIISHSLLHAFQLKNDFFHFRAKNFSLDILETFFFSQPQLSDFLCLAFHTIYCAIFGMNPELWAWLDSWAALCNDFDSFHRLFPATFQLFPPQAVAKTFHWLLLCSRLETKLRRKKYLCNVALMWRSATQGTGSV